MGRVKKIKKNSKRPKEQYKLKKQRILKHVNDDFIMTLKDQPEEILGESFDPFTI